MSALEIVGLRKGFGAMPVLRGLDLMVSSGTLTAVLGPSGCGKTTLLRVIAGFETPDEGTVALGGRVVVGPGGWLPPERRRIGIVPQEGALFPHLDVAGNVAFGLPRRSRESRVAEMLALVGLDGCGKRMPGELSGGQQQRVALARALAPAPDMVLLDEPFSALDTGLRAAIRQDVRAMLRQAGATALLVTHDQQEALSMADQVAVMRDGVVVQSASPVDVYHRPADRGVATFVGEAVVLDACLRADMAETALGRLPVRPDCSMHSASGVKGVVVLRPEQLDIVSELVGTPAGVRASSFHGHDLMVDLELRSVTGHATVRARCRGGRNVSVGAVVGLIVQGPVSFFPDC